LLVVAVDSFPQDTLTEPTYLDTFHTGTIALDGATATASGFLTASDFVLVPGDTSIVAIYANKLTEPLPGDPDLIALVLIGDVETPPCQGTAAEPSTWGNIKRRFR
jgi:hypothetical protein